MFSIWQYSVVISIKYSGTDLLCKAGLYHGGKDTDQQLIDYCPLTKNRRGK
jgi:hypothetical protein